MKSRTVLRLSLLAVALILCMLTALTVWEFGVAGRATAAGLLTGGLWKSTSDCDGKAFAPVACRAALRYCYGGRAARAGLSFPGFSRLPSGRILPQL